MFHNISSEFVYFIRISLSFTGWKGRLLFGNIAPKAAVCSFDISIGLSNAISCFVSSFGSFENSSARTSFSCPDEIRKPKTASYSSSFLWTRCPSISKLLPSIWFSLMYLNQFTLFPFNHNWIAARGIICLNSMPVIHHCKRNMFVINLNVL